MHVMMVETSRHMEELVFAGGEEKMCWAILQGTLVS